MRIDFFSKLPPWPAYSPADQVYWVNQLKVLLTNLDDQVESSLVYTVLLEQAEEPSQGDWETAYEDQTGLSLPIPPNTQLFWWDTIHGWFGGLYGTVSTDVETVYAKNNRYAPGQIVAFDSAYRNDAVSVTSAIAAITSTQPSLTMELTVPVRLELYYGLMTDLTASAGSWGIDITINGIKVGTQYYNIASNRGIAERNTDGYLQLMVHSPVLQPGTYTIQALFGVTSGTPTVAIGGSHGVRQLIVKAIAE